MDPGIIEQQSNLLASTDGSTDSFEHHYDVLSVERPHTIVVEDSAPRGTNDSANDDPQLHHVAGSLHDRLLQDRPMRTYVMIAVEQTLITLQYFIASTILIGGALSCLGLIVSPNKIKINSILE